MLSDWVRPNHFIHSSSANRFISFASSVPFNNSGHKFFKCKTTSRCSGDIIILEEINLQWAVMYLELESCWVLRLIMEMYICRLARWNSVPNPRDQCLARAVHHDAEREKKLARTRRRRNKGKGERMREAEQHDALFLSMDGYTYASLCLWAFRIKLPSSNTQQGGPSRTVHPSEREASRLQTFQLFQNINSFKPFAPVPFGAVMSRAAVWELKGEGDHTALQLQLLESGWSDHGPGHIPEADITRNVLPEMYEE